MSATRSSGKPSRRSSSTTWLANACAATSRSPGRPAASSRQSAGCLDRRRHQPELGRAQVRDDHERPGTPSAAVRGRRGTRCPAPAAEPALGAAAGGRPGSHQDLGRCRGFRSRSRCNRPRSSSGRRDRSGRRPPGRPARRRYCPYRSCAARPGTAGRGRRARCRRTTDESLLQAPVSEARCTMSGRSDAGGDIAKAQRVHLVTVGVDGVGEHPIVRADLAHLRPRRIHPVRSARSASSSTTRPVSAALRLDMNCSYSLPVTDFM